MTDSWTYDTYRQALERSGVGKEAAIRATNAKFGHNQAELARHATNGDVNAHMVLPATGAFLGRIMVPWTGLCSDNAKYTLNSAGRITLTNGYREAKLKARAVGREAMAGSDPFACPLRVVVEVWVPDERPHDCTNFLKCLLDGLEKVVYVNDRWLYDTRIIRAGVDTDRPRAEITVSPIP